MRFEFSIGELLRRAAPVWTVLGIVVAGGGWAILPGIGVETSMLVPVFLVTSVVVPILLFAASCVSWKCHRVKFIALLFGVAGIAPILATAVAIGAAYFMFVEHEGSVDLIIRLLLVCSLFLWCWREVNGLRRRIEERRFMEKEFSVEENYILMRAPTRTDLSPPPISDKTLLGKLLNKLGPYLIVLVPLAYPLQRLFADTGGIEAVLLLLALLGLPIVFHIAGRLACGTYLYIYRVGQLESTYGKPVILDSESPEASSPP